MGRILYKESHLPEAEEHHRWELDIRKDIPVDCHPDVADSLLDLSQVMINTASVAKAKYNACVALHIL